VDGLYQAQLPEVRFGDKSSQLLAGFQHWDVFIFGTAEGTIGIGIRARAWRSPCCGIGRFKGFLPNPF
jgi:hypothetical protein